jgi:hypothetical protein
MSAPSTGTNRKFITEGNSTSTSPEFSMLARDNTTTEQTLLSQFIRDDMNLVQVAYGVNTGTTTAFDNTFKILEHIDTKTQILTTINATAESSPVSYVRTAVPLTLNLFTIGCLIKTTPQQFMLCTVKEIVIIPSNASSDVKTRMQGYLAWNNGLESLLPSGHTYKTARPTI